MNRRRVSLVTLLVVVTLGATACSALRFGGPDHDMAGTWEGAVNVQGDRIPGSLAIEQEGRTLDVAFAAPSWDLDAAGEGEVSDDGSVVIELDYDLQCPGTATLEGELTDEDTVFSGSLEAVDCTGSIEGSFRFTR